jgi:cytochrome c biogenesis protein CcmG, thiol:disulfide interchange protein DsbE
MIGERGDRSGHRRDGPGRVSHRAVRTAAAIVVVALVAVGVYVASIPLGSPGIGSTAPSDARPFDRAVEGIGIGQAAPDFKSAGDGPGLTDLDLHPIRLADFEGKPLWIVFWATWCAPCQLEAPEILAAFHAHETDDLEVLAIDVQEPAVAARDYAETHELDYAIGLDATGSVMAQYGAAGLPSHVFVDRDGVIRDRYSGQLTGELMEQHLVSILGR